MATMKGQARFQEHYHHGHGGPSPSTSMTTLTMNVSMEDDNSPRSSSQQQQQHQVSPLGTAAQDPSSNSNKRLAGSREELEHSWGKRRKTTPCVDFHGNPMEMNAGNASFVNATRIDPANRPPKTAPATITSTPSCPPATVRAGWYRGDIDHFGNRSGTGTTRHDDGTEYTGTYTNDVMEGRGIFKFAPVHSPNTTHHPNVQRRIERYFEGTFTNDESKGKGKMVTATVDEVPPTLVFGGGEGGASNTFAAGVAATSNATKVVQVVHDVGHFEAGGRAVGEGVRYIFTKRPNPSSSNNVVMDEHNSTMWETNCFRLMSGECARMKVALSYAKWVCDCLQFEAPAPPS